MSEALRIGCISSYVPKKCGIATFSRDLLGGIKDNDRKVKLFVAAAEHAKESYKYDKEVVAILKADNNKSFLETSTKLNGLNLSIVLLEHEFGIYGGKFTTFVKDNVKYRYPTGDQIFKVLDRLSIPVITTLHTVVTNPDTVRRDVINRIAKASSIIVTMSQGSKMILCKDYDIAENKIVIIPHGTPKLVKNNRLTTLKELRLNKDNFYMVMSGLLGPNKGVDLAISAMPKILKINPEVRLVIIGQTHPDILAVEGNAYMNSLTKLAKKLKVDHAVSFIDKYVTTPELSKYLSITDIYLTPHRDPEQAASGTLAYAIGNGLITISTPYRYAQEMLAGHRGFLVPFENYIAISRTVNRLIADKGLRKKTKELIKTYGDTMSWTAVGKAYLKVINEKI